MNSASQTLSKVTNLQPVVAHATGYRDILVHVEAAQDAAPRLYAAVALARKLGARLTGIGAETIQPIPMADPSGVLGAWFEVAERESLTENLRLAETAFLSAVGEVDARWLAVEDRPDLAVERAARGADLIVAGGRRTPGGDIYHVARSTDLVLKSGRPVLIVPAQGGDLSADCVVVAWSDTREARRALADSLPFLRQAQQVIVIEVCRDDQAAIDGEVHTADVAAHLRRHGIDAEARVSTAGPDDIVGEIRRTAAIAGADLIVAGCYGHSPFAERVLGGVTHDLVLNCEQFLLMSH